jgi:hypothetical protein
MIYVSDIFRKEIEFIADLSPHNYKGKLNHLLKTGDIKTTICTTLKKCEFRNIIS